MFSADDLLTFPLPAAGLQASGFALVALLHAVYAVHLLRSGLLKRPLDPSGVWFIAAVLATVGWGAVGLSDQFSRKLFTCAPGAGL